MVEKNFKIKYSVLKFEALRAINHTGHVIKFLLIFRNNLRSLKKRYRFEILGNKLKGPKVFQRDIFFLCGRELLQKLSRNLITWPMWFMALNID